MATTKKSEKQTEPTLDYKALNREAKDLLTDINRFPEFCEKCIKIIPASGGDLISLKLNKIQMWFFNNYMLPAWLRGEPLRIIILKCRQTGMSTMITAFALWCTLGNKHWNSCLIAKDDKQVKIIFEMTHRYHEHLPVGDNNILPMFPLRRDSAAIIEFNKPDVHQYLRQMRAVSRKIFLDSRIRILSGEKKGDLGRAGTFQTVHASEAAFWVDLKNALSALLATCHYLPKTSIFLETTANGYNEFHSLWVNRAIGKVGVPSFWKNVFIPWYWDDRYELHGQDIEYKFHDEYEADLFKLIITDFTIEEVPPDRAWAKIFWRRMAINDRDGDVDLFSQEYPATDSEAFMSTGRAVFPKAHIKRMELKVRDPEWKGDIGLKETDSGSIAPFTKESEEGRFKIWEQPQNDEQYIIAADIAEGKAIEGLTIDEEKSRYDYSVAAVLKVTPFPPAKLVAMWHGSIDPDLYADTLVAIAKKYNNAYLGWEINGPGRGLNYHVCNRHRYNNVYLREDWDQGGQRVRALVGWHTTGYTKPSMVYIGKEFIRESAIEIYDIGTVNEMKAFSDMGNNKFGAATGHDDRVIAILIALSMAQPRVEFLKRKKERLAEKRKEREQKKSGAYRKKKESVNPILGSEM